MREEIKRLKEWNCDTDAALERFVDDEDLYIDMFIKYKRKLSVEQLREFIEQKNTEQAFAVAHDIKGVAGNLGVTPIYQLASRIVEPLRSGNTENLLPYVDQLEQIIQELEERFSDFQMSDERK